MGFTAFYVVAGSKSFRLPRERHFEPQKMLRAPGALTVLTSKSLARHSVVLRTDEVPSTLWGDSFPQWNAAHHHTQKVTTTFLTNVTPMILA